MPFLNIGSLWPDSKSEHPSEHPFWKEYSEIYKNSLGEGERKNAEVFDQTFFGNNSVIFSAAANRSALFIMLYRGYPMLELPYQLLESLLEIDNELGNWRSRHINMVRRMIGTRTGTGGSTGAGYLQGAMDKHYIFRELAQLNSFLINRTKLPKLPDTLTEKLGYHF